MPEHLGAEERPAPQVFEQRGELGVVGVLRNRAESLAFGRVALDVEGDGPQKRAEAGKRDLAFGVSLGVNALAVAAMVGVFAHTAGVTGTELGIVAATGFLNQKLLQAIFGEAAMREMIAGARERLEALLGDEFLKERSRYDRLTVDPLELRTLAEEMHAAMAPLTA